MAPRGRPRKPAIVSDPMTAMLDDAQRLHAEQIEKGLGSAPVTTMEPPAPAPAPAPVTAAPAPMVQAETPPAAPDASPAPGWKRKKGKPAKTTVVPCIVVDRFNHWHTATPVDLHGEDTTDYTWGYYGKRFPVLIEQSDGALKPWYFPDAVGESANRLYKGANPDGFRNTFKHNANMLQKIQVGLMVLLVLGLFFIMYVLINN